jgi:hypothetical protein
MINLNYKRKSRVKIEVFNDKQPDIYTAKPEPSAKDSKQKKDKNKKVKYKQERTMLPVVVENNPPKKKIVEDDRRTGKSAEKKYLTEVVG